MEQNDVLKPGDEVTVSVLGPENQVLYKSTEKGYHSLETAVTDILKKAVLEVNPEDCVFEITNNTKNVSHKYRINAHGNLKLIV